METDTITPTTTMTSGIATASRCVAGDMNCSKCRLAAATFEACSTAVPDWVDDTDPQAAACLCYYPASSNSSSFVWVPNQFDVPFSACPAWAGTALNPGNASVLASYTGFCSNIGNILSVTSTDTATIAPAAATSDGGSALQSGTSVAASLPLVASSQTAASAANGKIGYSVSLKFLCGHLWEFHTDSSCADVDCLSRFWIHPSFDFITLWQPGDGLRQTQPRK
jgi:hypothetical protein